MKKRLKTAFKTFAITAVTAAIVSCNNSNTTTTTIAQPSGSNLGDGIAFVYIDSLVNGYDLYNDEATKLMTKQNKYEQDLQSKGKSLERRALELQQNYEKHLITPTRAQEVQQQLAVEQQKLMQTRDQQAMELADDQAQIMNRVGDSIKNYIARFNADKRYKLIISTQSNSVLLYADPSMDITQTILNGLNESYRGNATKDTTSSK